MNSLFIIGFTFISVCFAGVSSECNIVEMSKCFTSFKMPENTQSMSPQDKQTMCASIRAVKSCIEPYKSACAANPSFTTMMSSMTQAAMLCGDSGCNLMKCYSDAGIVMDSTGGKSPNISCDGFMSLKTCVESQASACQQNPGYSNVQESLEKAGVMCGSPGCNIDECNIDFSFPNGIPSKSKYDIGCTALKAAIPCLESKSECPNLKALGTTSMTQAYKRFCEDATLKKGLETHKMCLKNATINAKCNKYLSPTMSDSGMTEETEKEECQRIGDYAMCAKKATSVCDNDEAMNFAAETARKVLFLKSRREGGIECATGSGIAASPALWIVFSAAMMVIAAIFP